MSAEVSVDRTDGDGQQCDQTEVTAATEADASTTSDVVDTAEPDDGPELSAKTPRRLSISVRALMVTAVIVILVAGLGTMAWLYYGAKTSLDDQARRESDIGRAQNIALDYAVNAAIMDFKDLGPWRQNLVKGTTPELSKKLTDAATAMEQILLPLQWTSTAKPLAAKVRSHDNNLYVVDAFVSVMTKTVQAAEDLQSTATYSITINTADNWLISDVGGIGAVVGDK